MINEENDQIIVDELRQMKEAPRDGAPILCALNGSEMLREMYFIDGFWRLAEVWELKFNDDHLQGWVPTIVYRPKDDA